MKPVYEDNEDGTITDTTNNLTWLKEDSWQNTSKETLIISVILGVVKCLSLYNGWKSPVIVACEFNTT